MRYRALACDYDGTLAHDGLVSPEVIPALQRCRESGRDLLIVTGRELRELQTIFDRLDLFAWVVAENGGTLYQPATGAEVPLAAPPPEPFVQALLARGVAPLSVGRVIVATWSPFETVIVETIRDLGLEMQVIFNKGAVMVLPSGINKASGLAAALEKLQIPLKSAVAIGDAENDHAFLEAAGLGVAVANAVPMLLERADLVTRGDHGRGVIELIDRLIEDDLAGIERHARPASSAPRA